jgi:hypothetical protein
MHGELYYTGAGNHAWGPKNNSRDEWYQFTFKEIVYVTNVKTRGSGTGDNWITSFKLMVS